MRPTELHYSACDQGAHLGPTCYHAPTMNATWRKLGVGIRDRGTVPDSIGDVEKLRLAIGCTTAHRGYCLLAMAAADPGVIGNTPRRLAHRGRRDALRSGVVLPPWWRLRVALRNAPPGTLERIAREGGVGAPPPGGAAHASEGPT